MKQDKMIEYQRAQSEKREKEILRAIRKMATRGEKVSVYSVSKETKCSRNYLYNNPKLMEAIQSYRYEPTTKTVDSTKAEIKLLRMEIVRLKRQLEQLQEENNETYKEKYLKEHEMRLALEKQLRTLYSHKAS